MIEEFRQQLKLWKEDVGDDNCSCWLRGYAQAVEEIQNQLQGRNTELLIEVGLDGFASEVLETLELARKEGHLK